MNFKIILFFLSRISIGMAGVLCIPLLVAMYYKEDRYAEYLIAIAMALIIATFFNRYSEPVKKGNVSVREGIGTVFFAWIMAALLGSFPFWFLGILDPASAFFESMSGLTTTGATAIMELGELPKSLLFWRVMMHWLGGIGIIVLFVALLPQIAGSAAYLFNAEVTGFSNSRILPRIRNTAVAIFYIYLLLTIIFTGILKVEGMTLYDSIYHACSAIATGGFSNYDSSINHFHDPVIEYTLSVFMLIAAGNFAVYYQVAQTSLKALWEDIEFKTYICINLVISLLIAINLISSGQYGVEQGFRAALFQVASFTSTTGFVSQNYDLWPSFSQLLLAATFFMGGCAGSTAGGIKICRLIVLVKAATAEMRRSLHPQMILSVDYARKRLPIQTIMNISRFFFVYIFIVALTALVLTLSGVSVEDALFSAASCLASVGPAFGKLGATGNYAELNGLAKITLSIAMLLGRLELFTALALLRKEYWQHNKRW